MSYYSDGGTVIFAATDIDRDLPEVPEPPEDSIFRDGDKKYVWDSGSSSFVEKNEPPNPSEAMKEIIAYYASLNQDASNPTKSGRIQLNNLLSAYPGAQGALQAGEYDELTGDGGYLEIAVEDSDLPDFDSTMRSDIEDILAGKTSYL